MKPLTRTVFLDFSVLTMLTAVNPLLSYAEEERLSQQEFARICAENHAEESRRLHPPLKDPELDPFNYEFHYREVLLIRKVTEALPADRLLWIWKMAMKCRISII